MNQFRLRGRETAYLDEMQSAVARCRRGPLQTVDRMAKADLYRDQFVDEQLVQSQVSNDSELVVKSRLNSMRMWFVLTAW
jgi:hypothetical protein